VTMEKQQTGRREDVAALVEARYRLLRRLDVDELVEIWIAQDELLDRCVVLKRLHDGLLSEPSARDAFHAEATAVASISHVNVARRYEVEVRGDVAYTISEHVEGPNLAELCAKGPLVLEAAASVGFQAAAGLAAAHEQGVVHRDVGPRTMVIGTDGRLRLAFFRMPSIPGVGVGPPPDVQERRHYLAPERFRGGAPTTASDVYGLGRALQLAWSGSLDAPLEPAPRGPVLRTLRSLPGVLTDDRDARLREIILAATEPTPEWRPPASELRDHLSELSGARGELVLRPLVSAPA
jgi:eukaryotic-like serine/threonine-protein kinase